VEIGAREVTAWLGAGPGHQTFLAASGDLVLRIGPTLEAARADLELAAADLHEALSAGGRAIAAPRYPPETGEDTCLVVRDPVGRPLRQRTGGWPEPLARALGAALLDALAPWHERGDFHGALTADRILAPADAPGVLLVDAGLASVAQDLSESPIRTITPGFSELWTDASLVPPEIVRGEELSPASDVFLVAALTWRWLTGRDAYRAPKVLGVLARLGRGERPSLLTMDLGLPVTLARAIDAALSPEPTERPAPEELLAVLRPEAPVALDPAFASEASAWSRSRPRRAPEDAPSRPGSAAETERQARLRRAALALEVGGQRARGTTGGRRVLAATAAVVLGVALAWGLHLLTR
jgi:hypothetical protein